MPKVQGSGCVLAKIDINMTPMIDVVFQLLTFFLMTFKVAAAEGDFELRLPRDEISLTDPGKVSLERLTLRLVAGPDGDLAQLQLANNLPLVGAARFDVLHDQVVRLVNAAHQAGVAEPELQIDADDGLRYEYVIQTVAAVSARRDDAGNVVPLIKKIQFRSPH